MQPVSLLLDGSLLYRHQRQLLQVIELTFSILLSHTVLQSHPGAVMRLVQSPASPVPHPPELGQVQLICLPLLTLLPAGHWWGDPLLQGVLVMAAEALMRRSASWWQSQCRSGAPRTGAHTGSCRQHKIDAHAM
jgi:hypothetical protein